MKYLKISMLVLGGILVAFGIWSFIESTKLISEAVAAGTLKISESLFDIASYYISGSFQYLAYGAILIGLSLNLNPHPFITTQKTLYGEPKETVEEDEDLETWYHQPETT